MDPQNHERTPDGRLRVECDSLGCLNGLSTPAKGRTAVALEYAVDQGWVVDEEGHTFCPLHREIHPQLWPVGVNKHPEQTGNKDLGIEVDYKKPEPFRVIDNDSD